MLKRIIFTLLMRLELLICDIDIRFFSRFWSK